MPKITDLSAAATLDGTEEAPIHQGSSTVKMTLEDLRAYVLAIVADLDMGSHKITNVTDPASAQDAATKAYVDANAGGGGAVLTTKGDILTFDTAQARLPVGTDGQVLTADSAQSLGVKWGAAGGMGAKIDKVVTSGSQSTITFSSIPATYTDLLLVFSGRDTGSTGEVAAQMKVNGDGTAANYTSAQFNVAAGTGTSAKGTVAATTSGVSIGIIPGVSGNANAIGMTIVTIPNYAGTTFHKIINQDISYIFGSTLTKAQQTWIWKSTAAITSLTITANGAFVDGTTATLYGIG